MSEGARWSGGRRRRSSARRGLGAAAVTVLALFPVVPGSGGAGSEAALRVRIARAAAQEPADSGRAAQERTFTAAEVKRAGRADVAIDRRLGRLLGTDPLVVTRDTQFTAADTIRRSVLVLDATVIHEGVITGDLVLVDAGAFVRPRSVVEGDLVNVGGGLYRSELARVRGTILDLALADYRVVREPDRIVIAAGGAASPLELDDFYGFHPPIYDRVNGVTAVWGATYRLPPIGAASAAVHAQGGWLTQRGEPTWEADAAIRWGAVSLFGGYEESWATNEQWIQGDLKNALHYAWNGRDYRDYHDVQRGWVGASHAFGDDAKRFHAVLSVRGQIEDATSLAAGDPWHLWGDSARINPAVDDGRISSVVAGLETRWRGLQTEFEGHVEYEGARDWEGGEAEFDRLTVGGEWAMHALADHTLEIEFFGQTPLGGDALPRQRWSFVGGSGTLQTVGFAEYYGDHVVYVETKYIIPFPDRVALPVLGPPEIQLLHTAGMAWTAAEERDLVQEVGARLQFFGLYLRYMVAPDGSRDPDFDVGVSWPFGSAHPWEQKGEKP